MPTSISFLVLFTILFVGLWFGETVVASERLPATQGAQSSGLLNVDVSSEAEMFYWLFRSSNSSAPMIIWLEGGPGIPGSFQVFYGMGPYRISHTLNVTLNPETWNNEFHLLFFDNPVGVGYSSVAGSNFLTTEEQVAQQLYKAVEMVLEIYPEFSETLLYLAGESYGGKYVPSLAYYLLQQEYPSWKVEGIAIGNGLVNPSVQVQTFADYAYFHGITTLHQKTEIEDYQRQFQVLYDAGKYNEASNIYWAINYYLKLKIGVNFYNVDCDTSCDLEHYIWGAYTKLLDVKEVKEQLHVPVEYVFNAQVDGASAALNPDVCKSVAGLFPTLLEHYKVLLFQGTLDIICNAAGNDLWLSQVNWSGMSTFQETTQTKWMDGVDIAGWLRTSSNLTQINLPNAGHMVTMDQPSRALQMISNWINNVAF